MSTEVLSMRAPETEIRARKQQFKALLEEGLKSINLTAEEWIEAVKETRMER